MKTQTNLMTTITNPTTPKWLADYRLQHRDAFLQHGLPTRQQERWKYTDLAFLQEKNFAVGNKVDADVYADVIAQHRMQRGEAALLVFINGYFIPTLSDIQKLPNAVILRSLDQALETHAEMIKAHLLKPIDTKQYPLASLNAANAHDGLFFYVPDQCELATPIHLLSLVVDAHEFMAHPQHLFIFGDHSKVTLIEEYYAPTPQTYFMNIATTIVIGEAAQLDYYKLQNEGPQAVHSANTFIQQKQDSHISYTNFSAGAQFARDDLVVTLQEPGAACHASGFYYLHQDNQYIDHHLDIQHAAPRTHSEMNYKGILAQKSRAVFNGRLHVDKNAQKIVAHQANHNLLLSNQAEVYSKPELEIYADDVKCKHGATIGQLDQDALFYLQARGIAQEDAIPMLLHAFTKDITQRIQHPGVKLKVEELFNAIV